jgi:hypothetical protein
MGKIAQQQRNIISCAVGAVMLQAGQVLEEVVSWFVS